MLLPTPKLLSAWPAIVLLMAACAQLPDDEAGWLLEDLAAGAGASRLKRLSAAPSRQQLAYTVDDRRYRGDIYLPAEPPLAAMVLVPGVAEAGKDDPRLVNFATTLARARFAVLTPDIANLRALRVSAQDAQAVAHAFRHLHSRAECAARCKIGIGAFSYAVGPAMLAALDPVIRDDVDFILGVGGYYDLEEVITFFTTGYYQQQGEWRYLPPNSYGKWVFMLSNAELLSRPSDQTALQAIARRRLADADADIDSLRAGLSPPGRSLLALLENRDPSRAAALIEALPPSIRAHIETLTLANKPLSSSGARLILLHGSDDPIIPSNQSAALAAAVRPGQANLFIIDGLAHVDVNPLGLDRSTAWRAVSTLLAQRATEDGAAALRK
jgi:hypothetical protein